MAKLKFVLRSPLNFVHHGTRIFMRSLITGLLFVGLALFCACTVTFDEIDEYFEVSPLFKAKADKFTWVKISTAESNSFTTYTIGTMDTTFVNNFEVTPKWIMESNGRIRSFQKGLSHTIGQTKQSLEMTVIDRWFNRSFRVFGELSFRYTDDTELFGRFHYPIVFSIYQHDQRIGELTVRSVRTFLSEFDITFNQQRFQLYYEKKSDRLLYNFFEPSASLFAHAEMADTKDDTKPGEALIKPGANRSDQADFFAALVITDAIQQELRHHPLETE